MRQTQHVLDTTGCAEASEAAQVEMSSREALRIVYVIDSLRLGGAERHLHRLLQQANKSGHWRASVYCLDRQGPLVEAIELLGVPVVGGTKPWSKSPTLLVESILALRAYLRAERPTIVHCYLSTAGLLGAIGARLAGVPYVITTRRTVHTYRGLRLFRYRSVTLVMNRLSGAVVAVCEAARKQAVREGADPSKVVTIYNAVSPPRSAARTTRRVQEETVIGAVGSLHADKGHRYLVEAVPSILREVPNARFVFVGDGPERASLESRVMDLGISSRVTFLGQRADVTELLPQFDIFVQPSLREGLPNAVLEASALGLPIVATAVGGVPEVIEHGRTGLLVSPGSSPELARALVQLVRDDALRASLGFAAKTASGTRFSPEREFQETDAVYRTVIKRHPTRSVEPDGAAQKKLRIAFVVPSYFPVWGGVQTQVKAQARELIKRGHEVQIITWKRDPVLPAREVVDGVPVYRVDRWRRGVWHDALAFLQMAYVLTKAARRVDVIAAYHLLSTAFLAGYAALLTGTPIISRAAAESDPAGTDLGIMTGSGVSQRIRRFMAWPLRRGSVVALSSSIAENLQELGFQRIVRIPNGVEDAGVRDREQLRHELYEPLGIPTNAPVAVAVGRLVDQKGFDLLISAWGQVRAAQNNAVVVIVGSGPREAALRAAAVSDGVADSVHFVPFTRRARDYLSASSVAVLPSRFEGLSNVLLEAMMDGVPVVATRVSGAVDLIEDGVNGRLVPVDDSNSLAEALADVLREPSDLGRRARETALMQCELSRVVDMYLWLFSAYHNLPEGIVDPVNLLEPLQLKAERTVCAESAE